MRLQQAALVGILANSTGGHIHTCSGTCDSFRHWPRPDHTVSMLFILPRSFDSCLRFECLRGAVRTTRDYVGDGVHWDGPRRHAIHSSQGSGHSWRDGVRRQRHGNNTIITRICEVVDYTELTGCVEVAAQAARVLDGQLMPEATFPLVISHSRSTVCDCGELVFTLGQTCPPAPQSIVSASVAQSPPTASTLTTLLSASSTTLKCVPPLFTNGLLLSPSKNSS